MLHLIVDYITRHPLPLGFVFLLGMCWSGGTERELGGSPLFFMIAQMALFSFYGLMLDIPKGYLRVMGMLPLSRQEVVRTLWLLGVCLGPAVALAGYWIVALIHVLVGVLWGKFWIPSLWMFFVFFEILIGTIALGWSLFVISGDPSKKNLNRNMLGWVWGFLWLWPLFIPKSWFQVLYDVSPYTVLPVVLISGAISYLLTPLIFTSGPSLSWPGGLPKPSKKTVATPISFPSRQMSLLRGLFNPMFKVSLMMGIGMVVWIGIMVLYLPGGELESGKPNHHFQQFFGMMMTMMLIFFIFGIGASSTVVMRGLRVLPVHTQLMAGLMTLFGLEAYVGFGFVIVLWCLVYGEWAMFSGLLPSLILLAGFSSVILALVFRNERLVPLYIGGLILVVLFSVLNEQAYLPIESWVVCSLVALILFGMAFALNLSTLRHKSSLYRPRVIFGQLAPQVGRWHSGG